MPPPVALLVIVAHDPPLFVEYSAFTKLIVPLPFQVIFRLISPFRLMLSPFPLVAVPTVMVVVVVVVMRHQMAPFWMHLLVALTTIRSRRATRQLTVSVFISGNVCFHS